MERRTALATAAAVAVSGSMLAFAIGAGTGLFGFDRRTSEVGRLNPAENVSATDDATPGPVRTVVVDVTESPAPGGLPTVRGSAPSHDDDRGPVPVPSASPDDDHDDPDDPDDHGRNRGRNRGPGGGGDDEPDDEPDDD